jgi:hypothetical protein
VDEKIETVMRPPAFEEDFSDKTDRELLERLLRELGSMRSEINGIKTRLAVGDQLFQLAEKRELQHCADWTVAMRFMQSLNVRMARHDPGAAAEAEQIEDAIQSRFPPNGAAERDIPTSPDNSRPPEPDAE